MGGVYSHGDHHPVDPSIQEAVDVADPKARRNPMDPVAVVEKMDSANNEWFAHLPYPATAPEDVPLVEEMLAPIAVAGAKGKPGRDRPDCFLYATQLRMMFVRAFSRFPERPIVCLLNFCRSGGFLEFLSRPAARAAYGVDKWPLYIMASSQAEHDALVGGL